MTTILFILTGLKLTLLLTCSVLLLSLPTALILVYLNWQYPSLDRCTKLFTWVMRGTPLLLQLFFIYYGLGMVGVNISAVYSAIIAFSVNYMAYFIIIFQEAFFHDAIDQIEAGLALGMGKKIIFRKILLPQAFQKCIGVLSNETLTLLKDTALVSTIGLADLMRNAREIVVRDFVITPFIWTFFIYLGLSFMIVKIFAYFNKQDVK